MNITAPIINIMLVILIITLIMRFIPLYGYISNSYIENFKIVGAGQTLFPDNGFDISVIFDNYHSKNHSKSQYPEQLPGG